MNADPWADDYRPQAKDSPVAEPYLSSIGDHRESIRNFLGMIDPESGYIE